MGILSSYTGFSRMKKAVVIVMVLVLLYTILGFLVAPPIVKSILVANISEKVSRDTSVEKIKVNPFALSVALQNFEMKELDGGPFVAFDELYVNFQLSSIYRKAFSFEEVRLVGPDGRVKVLPDGTLNFADILAALNSAEAEADQSRESTEMPPVTISRLQVTKGRLAFSDLSRPTPFETTISPIQFAVENFSTLKDRESPYAFTAALGAGTMLRWEGDLSVNPLSSEGRFELSGIQLRTVWEYVQDLVKFQVNGGSIDLAGQYKVDLSGETIRAEVMDGGMQLAGFKLSEKGRDEELISVPKFSVQGVHVNLNEKKVVVESVHSGDGWFLLVRDRDGEYNYQKLIPAELFESKSTEMKTERADGPEAWEIRVNQAALENYELRVEDHIFEKPMVATLDSINFDLKNLTNKKESEAEVNLALSIDKQGRVEVGGIASIDPVSVVLNLRVSKTPLRALQAYLETLTKVQLASAALNLDAQLKYNRFGGDGPLMRFEGDISIDDIKLVERSSQEDLARCESLVANGLTYDVNPNRIGVSEIVLKQPYAKVIILPDATVNLANAFATRESETGKQDLLLFEKIVRAFELQLKQQMVITMDKVRIESGSADFADLSIKPNFAADIKELNGTIKGLSSKDQSRADVLMEGKVNRHAPVKITGQLNPLSSDVYLDLALSFKSMELTSLSPYSGKFAGYLIEKGKMSVDLKYKVSENILVGENEIVLKKLTLGEKVDSPDATSLPVGLAIALLKDRDGNIELDVPVSGNLRDPQFDIGGVVAKALGDLIARIVTSPFALLGSLVGGGGGEELEFIEFDFGSVKLDTKQVKKLDELAKALNERPALSLEIEGTADKESDRMALADKELLSQLKRAKSEELRKAGKPVPAKAEEIRLSIDDYNRLITQAYMDKFGKDPSTTFVGESKSSAEATPKIDQEVIIATARQKLLETMPLDETRLKRLAQERAMQIEDHLVQKGKIADDRLYLLGIEIIEGTDGETVRTHLTLSGT